MLRNVSIFSILFFVSFLINAQIKVTGNVLDVSTNKPISHVAILLNTNDTIVYSDEFGMFELIIPQKNVIINAKHIAYAEADSISRIDCRGAAQQCAITLYMIPKNILFQPVTITAVRADVFAPVTYTNIKGSELNENNFGKDMPFLLESTPSAVVTSDAGNGVGYTGIRIRGSDATRVNVTINGVPYNDAESQQTYWVDLPDFASSVDDIQIQRGVGTSTYGISALGASINIFTNKLDEKPYANINTSVGSFNLLKTSAAFGTGKIREHWYFEGRASKINSDGFVDRSYADLSSYFLTGAYKSKKYASILNVFSGKEKTYQAWAGVSPEILDTNRTYNPYTYENQTDNYVQTHFQWHHHFYFKKTASLDITFNYTKGRGYYEQLEEEQLYSDYGVENPIISTDTIYSTDLITQKWLDNDYMGAYLQYKKGFGNSITLNSGAAYYQFNGSHFGNVIWAEYATPFGINYEWYNNEAIKKDGNVFSQLLYDVGKLKFLFDLQVRQVYYDFIGADDLGIPVEQNVQLTFFNPKFGVTWLHHVNANTYLYFGKSSKEPNRNDYIESSPLSRPNPEILYNIELGERIKLRGWQLMANYYFMFYKDQLVLTGQINDVGAYTRTNIAQSYRTGVEIAWSKLFYSKLSWNGNIAYSKNIITNYNEFVDNWDTGIQTEFAYTNTQIAFSPSVVAYNNLKYTVLQHFNESKAREYHLDIGFITKYVGKQYADNTQNEQRSIDPYLVNDLMLSYRLSAEKLQQIRLSFIVQNVLNHEYESNAWVYRYIYENAENQFAGYYPQAGRNWVLQLSVVF